MDYTPITVCSGCRSHVWVAPFDDGTTLMVDPNPSALGTVVILEDGRFHLMRGPTYPLDAVRYSLHTCNGAR